MKIKDPLGLGLKPCPFCGNEIGVIDVSITSGLIDNLRVYCGNCDIDVSINSTILYANGEPIVSGAESIVDKWNRRTSCQENEK